VNCSVSKKYRLSVKFKKNASFVVDARILIIIMRYVLREREEWREKMKETKD